MILKLGLTQLLHRLLCYFMRKIISLFAVLFLFLSTGLATEKKAFDEFLKKATNASKGIPNEKEYEKFEFTNSKTGEKKKFADFPEVDRTSFIISRLQQFEYNLASVYEKWEEELKKAEDAVEEEAEANKKDVEAYMKELMDIRKACAIKLEQLLEDLFKKHPNAYTKEEQEHILKSAKDFHDKHKLIKRDK